ncbi:hypothetical protein DFH11DRAFT_1548824 [Phellopilus nigrolimitatus]|nr:hypothetical protein DFH11DRAFT_1548824 [Phellopilus nigrolimitatus]
MSSSNSNSFGAYIDFNFSLPISASNTGPTFGLNDDAILGTSYNDQIDLGMLDFAAQNALCDQLQEFERSLLFAELENSLQVEPLADPAPAHSLFMPQDHPQLQPQPQREQDNTVNEKGKDDVRTNIFPPRNPLLRLHTPAYDQEAMPSPESPLEINLFEAGGSDISTVTEPLLPFGYPIYPMSLDANGNPDPIILTSLGLPQLPSPAPEASVSHSEPKRAHRRKLNAPKSRAPAKKAKTRADNTWHVITPPSSASPPPPIPDFPTPRSPTESSGGEGSSSNTSALKRRRKQVFQHVGEPKDQTRPKWFENKAWVRPPSPPPIKKKDYGPHSDMGWVLARLREPNCERARYGWAVAQIENPYRSTYFVLSGPHSRQIKMVRKCDRVAYSPDKIAELNAINEGKSLRHRDIVYGAVTVDLPEIKSSYFANMAGCHGIDSVL